jgi:hypothetical protein
MEIIRIDQFTGVAQVLPLNKENPIGFCDPVIRSSWKPDHMVCKSSCFCPLKNHGPLPTGRSDGKCPMKNLQPHISCHVPECLDEGNDEEMTIVHSLPGDQGK